MNRRMLLLRLLLCRNGVQRAKLLKKIHYFNAMGENCYWHPFKVPSEGQLVTIHNNVAIASNVTFITHDIMSWVFNQLDSGEGKKLTDTYFGKIEIDDNVFIGANSTILYDVHIGKNSIIAAGSVVVKDVPSGAIVGGNPAKVIGSFSDLMQRRLIG